MVERRDVGVEVLGEDVFGDVGEPVGQEEGRVLAERSIVEHLCVASSGTRASGRQQRCTHQQELCAACVCVGRLERVRDAGGEVPEVSLVLHRGVSTRDVAAQRTYDSANKVLAVLIDRSHLHRTLNAGQPRGVQQPDLADLENVGPLQKEA